MQEQRQTQTITDTTMADQIIAYLQATLNQRDSTLTLTADTPLLQSGLIDSLTLFQLIDFVQKEFAVTIKPPEITLENFATVRTIEQLLVNKKSERCYAAVL